MLTDTDRCPSAAPRPNGRGVGRWLRVVWIGLGMMALSWACSALGAAQSSGEAPGRLPRADFKNGQETLQAFESISRATRRSVVKVDLNGTTVALAAVIDTNGLAVTKASEIKEGKLTGWVADGKEVEIALVRVDEKNDLALIQIKAAGLEPIRWAAGEVFVGQWVVTPGIAETPQAVGIISVPRRKILPKRALIGVRLDFKTQVPRIAKILKGLGAEEAGLRPGDRVLSVNGRSVSEREELIRTLRAFREGESVKLRVQREGEQLEATVKMMAPKAEGSSRETDREDEMNRMGSEPSQRAEGFDLALQHDTVLQAWQCGGPLVNLDGQAVGLNIARAGRVASYALPADLVLQVISQLQRASRTQPKEGKSRTGPPPAP